MSKQLTIRRRDATPMTDARAQAIATDIGATFFRSGERILHGWQPPLRRAEDDVRSHGRLAMARAIESLQNSGWLAGAIDAATAGVVGPGLRLNAKPDYMQLKWSEDQASEWGRMVERAWEGWANNPLECDAAGKASIGQRTAQAFRGWFAYGEILATIESIRRPGTRHRTKLQLLDPVSLPRQWGRLEARDSIITDAYGAPQSYLFKVRDPNSLRETDRTVPARTNTGRPLVVHVFDGAAQQRRGIAPLAPVLHVVRKYDQLSDATLTTALLQTIFAATLETPSMPEEVWSALQSPGEQGSTSPSKLEDYFGERLAWYKQSAIDLQEHGKVAHLFPGEKFEFKGPKAVAPNYEVFAKFLLRECARCIGVTFETMTGDYSGATYSSVRMATSELWQIVLYRRQNIASRLPQAAYEAWLEEAIFEGEVPFPGGFDAFLANRTAAVKADWRGPARPTADDQKATVAAATRIAAGLSTLEIECGENGYDWEEVIDQLAREQSYLDKRGIVLSSPQSLAQQQADIAKEQPAKPATQGA